MRKISTDFSCILLSQIGSLMSNLTANYANFVKFITTEPSFFTQLRLDAGLLNRQIVAVSHKPAAVLALYVRCTAVTTSHHFYWFFFL